MKTIEKRDEIFVFKCPGCKCDHHFSASWQFDGDCEKPTVSPSILTRFEQDLKKIVCHIFIKDGMIQYLDDCTHELAGKNVPMEPIE